MPTLDPLSIAIGAGLCGATFAAISAAIIIYGRRIAARFLNGIR